MMAGVGLRSRWRGIGCRKCRSAARWMDVGGRRLFVHHHRHRSQPPSRWSAIFHQRDLGFDTRSARDDRYMVFRLMCLESIFAAGEGRGGGSCAVENLDGRDVQATLAYAVRRSAQSRRQSAVKRHAPGNAARETNAHQPRAPG